MIFPLEPIPQHLLSYEKILEKNRNYFLYPLPDEWSDLFPSEKYEKESEPSWNDYIYQTKKIAEYSGRALDGQRNHVKHFIHNYSFEVHPFQEKFQRKAHELLEKWHSTHSDGADFDPCSEAIDHFIRIGLSGIVLLVDEKVIGFCLGQYLNQNIYDIQFAKADVSFQGVYSFLFQKMAQTISCEWLNFEFDLGIPGLRKNKLEYAPDHLAVKWRVKRK